MKKKKFVFRLNGKIEKVDAVDVTEDAEILFKGDGEIPEEILAELETSKTSEVENRRGRRVGKRSGYDKAVAKLKKAGLTVDDLKTIIYHKE